MTTFCMSCRPLIIEQPNGAAKAVDVVSKVNDHEKKLLQACYEGLKGNISKGVEFVANPPAK